MKRTNSCPHHLTNNTKQGIESSICHLRILKKSGKINLFATQTFNQLMQQGIDLKDIVGISVTTFGVDGAPGCGENDQQLYPIISWKCPRTIPVMENLSNQLDIKSLYQK